MVNRYFDLALCGRTDKFLDFTPSCSAGWLSFFWVQRLAETTDFGSQKQHNSVLIRLDLPKFVKMFENVL